ncbi:response regulator [Flavobacterium suncheonense]|uniref:Chemotaxis protein CheY n=1 Tax=Flavobacterium suncheonense GH29-5 = DSM 17707 TaxID=1121899 RepID=A0A0A2MCN6_9FLAO|nr:response regulator [Flavobacterium suncheonense]KGO89401.1 chemotaxis protein CheY [Flavobacterium suncheonense GH29-5 = DSM 17707]
MKSVDTLIDILLVEDNEGDIVLTTEALEESNIINTVNVVRNGKEAIDYVFNEGNYKDVSQPDLILLDVNLPLKSGHEVLTVIKGDERTKHIPVIMLSTSSSERDINLSYKNHVNCYITKPVELTDFFDAVTNIEQFWFNTVKLPVRK